MARRALASAHLLSIWVHVRTKRLIPCQDNTHVHERRIHTQASNFQACLSVGGVLSRHLMRIGIRQTRAGHMRAWQVKGVTVSAPRTASLTARRMPEGQTCWPHRPPGVWGGGPPQGLGYKKAKRPSGRRGSREGRTDVGGLRLWRIGRGLHPRQESCAPLSISLGTAEVGGAYRKPGIPVKSQSALPAVWTGHLAVLMGARSGQKRAYAASGEGRASATCSRGY